MKTIVILLLDQTLIPQQKFLDFSVLNTCAGWNHQHIVRNQRWHSQLNRLCIRFRGQGLKCYPVAQQSCYVWGINWLTSNSFLKELIFARRASTHFWNFCEEYSIISQKVRSANFARKTFNLLSLFSYYILLKQVFRVPPEKKLHEIKKCGRMGNTPWFYIFHILHSSLQSFLKTSLSARDWTSFKNICWD